MYKKSENQVDAYLTKVIYCSHLVTFAKKKQKKAKMAMKECSYGLDVMYKSCRDVETIILSTKSSQSDIRNASSEIGHQSKNRFSKKFFGIILDSHTKFWDPWTLPSLPCSNLALRRIKYPQLFFFLPKIADYFRNLCPKRVFFSIFGIF